MRIVCPACAATYEVPLSLLKPGQATRCARCAGEWVPTPEVPPPVMEAEAEPERPEVGLTQIELARRISAPPQMQPGAALRVAWVVSALALLAVGWGAYAQRTTIMQAWPPSIRLYAALGLSGDR
jgi:predicted Zn finger-like uncharacterized protein